MAVEYEPVIGLEVHAQLKTKSKIFCGCPTDFGAKANHNVCPVCLGMPGVLPVLNKRVVEIAIKTGLALNCHIAEDTRFDRKNYFYPDLAKGYQISQFDRPICSNGYLVVNGVKVRINRAHLEEDAGKLVHAGADGLHGSDYSKVDFNRSSMPLLEIVSEPDIRSAEQAEEYLRELRSILRYIGASDGNLEEGSFRCDANVSIRPVGQEKFGTRTEIKNMNSFQSVRQAIDCEIARQTKALEKGEKITQETRLWTGKDTHVMRSKEDSHDYRYFPEPDLVPLKISRAWVKEINDSLEELPEARRQRYLNENNLSLEDATILAASKEMSDFFDNTLKLGVGAKQAANLLMGPTIAYMTKAKKEFHELTLTPENLRDIIACVADGKVNSTTAKDKLLAPLLAEPGDVLKMIDKLGLAQVSDESALKAIVQGVLDRSVQQLEDYKKGKVKLRQYFLGEIMKETKGKANPQILNKLLDELLPPVETA
jgi:aspartyl-tRNA(Asn)/glutamyl-tRNA(Gln) amidotransferase subunit B